MTKFLVRFKDRSQSMNPTHADVDDEQRGDKQLRELIDNVEDENTKAALIGIQRRYKFYADRNRSLISAGIRRLGWFLAFFVVLELVIGVVGQIDNGNRISDIQNSRLQTCQRQNRAHDQTLVTIDMLTLKRFHIKPASRQLADLDRQVSVAISTMPNKAQRIEIAASFAGTRLIINKAIQKRDCATLVNN